MAKQQSARPTVHHFASSVAKIAKDGTEVISNYITEGETLTNGVTFEEALQGILVKVPEVKHQDNTYALTTDDTVTHTQQVDSKKEPEAEKVQTPAATVDEVPSQGDSGPAKTTTKTTDA